MAYSLASLPPHIRMFLQSRMASGQIDQNTLNMLLSGRIDLQSWLQQNGGPPLAGMPNRYPEQQNRDVTPQDPRTAQTTRVSGPAPIQPIQEMQRPGPIYGVEGTMTDAMRSNPDYQVAQAQQAQMQAQVQAQAQAEFMAMQQKFQAQEEAKAQQQQQMAIQPIQEMQRPGPIYGVEGTMTDAMRSNPDYQAAQQQMNMQPTPQMPEWMQFASALPNSPYGGPSGGGQTGPFSANLGTRI